MPDSSDNLYNVKLPSLSVGMEEAAIIEWLVEVGDAVRRDQPLCVVETDKVDINLESPVSGQVKEILVEPGRTVPIGQILATLEVSRAQ